MIIGNKPGRWVYYARWADTIHPFAQLDGPSAPKRRSDDQEAGAVTQRWMGLIWEFLEL
jgi:hypothetical protein